MIKFSIFFLLLSLSFSIQASDTYYQGMQALRSHQVDQAIKIFSDILANQSEHEDARYGLVLAHLKKGNSSQAKVIYKDLMGLDPHYYLYRLDFDLHLKELKNDTDFVKSLNSAQISYFWQSENGRSRLAKNAKGIYLFDRGKRILVHKFVLEAPSLDN